MYRAKAGCFVCGKKTGVSPFIKLSQNGDLICRSCYCANRRGILTERNRNLCDRADGENAGKEGRVSDESSQAVRVETEEDEDGRKELDTEFFLKLTGEDFKNEIQLLETAIFRHAGSGKAPIYDPEEFYQFCLRENASNIFNFIVSSVRSNRHSKDRMELNKKRAVAILYQICFSLSQKCDVLQKDNALFLKLCHLTDEGIDTQRCIGTTCCSRVVKREISQFSKQKSQVFEGVVKAALQNESLVILMIDDWTKIYTKKRPTDSTTSVADNFCTIIIKVVDEIRAIPLRDRSLIHNPVGIDVDLLSNFVLSQGFMQKLSCTFVSTLPELSVLFFDPLMERQRLEAHDYHASTAVRSMRSFNGVHLLDFVKLPLKSRENYETALGLVLQSHLKEYLSKYVVLMPGDWPSQFFPRQIVYRACSSAGVGTSPDPVTSIVPCMGPLHVDLNADEDIMTNYISFVRFIYESLFPGRKLADKPKPWRTQFTLEIIYGGWTLVRNTVKAVFHQCKDVQYGVLLNLLDNYIPLTLATYNILFKLNRLNDYFYAIFRLWIMFFCFHRRHYNKSPLVWLSNILFWKEGGGSKDIYNVFANNLSVIDEYFVEHVHSVIRRQTQVSDSDEQVQEKVHAIFASSERQANFRTNFTPPKNSVFSRQQLTSLYCKAATVITNVLVEIASRPQAATLLPRQPGQRRDCSLWSLPSLFGQKATKSYILPLGYNFHPPPDPQKRCDSPSCAVTCDLPWKLFEGCWHSFHLVCLGEDSTCFICKEGLNKSIRSLAATANEAFVTPANNAGAEGPQDDDDSGEQVETTPDDGHDIPDPGEVNVDQVIQGLTRQILSLSVEKPTASNTSSTITEGNITTNQHTSGRKPRHCSTCKHIIFQVHSTCRGQNGDKVVNCSKCPSQICCRGGGGVTCSCSWCLHNTPSHHVNTTPISSSTIGPRVVVENHRADVTEWLLSVCQSNVAGQSGSNACTVIAVLVAVSFLLPTGWVLPRPEDSLPQAFVSMFKETMVQGNIVHQWIGSSQQNYSVPEVVQHPSLGFNGVARCGDEYQFTSFQQFSLELTAIVATQQQRKLATVIILPPDKTMVLLIGEMAQTVLLESHQHMEAGAIVAAAGPNKIKEMVFYIEEMAKRDWGRSPVPFDVSFVVLL